MHKIKIQIIIIVKKLGVTNERLFNHTQGDVKADVSSGCFSYGWLSDDGPSFMAMHFHFLASMGARAEIQADLQ